MVGTTDTTTTITTNKEEEQQESNNATPPITTTSSSKKRTLDEVSSSPTSTTTITTKKNKMDTKMEETATAEVDEKLYSRQLYVMGHEAQRRMMASRVLLVGCSGLGVEVAKNCILAGVSSITLVDPHPANSYDLGGNFYLSESDLGTGKSRAELVAPSLAELNPYVKVSCDTTTKLEGESLVALVKDMAVVVVTIPLPTQVLVALDEACREMGVCFISSVTCGVFGQVFCDFGPQFVVSDKDGEQPHQSQVEHILCENPAVVKVLEDQGRHNLETGDYVQFSRIQGLDNQHLTDSSQSYQVKSTGPYTFELVDCDFSSVTTPGTQGYITQVKQPITMSFASYAKALEDPGELMLSDFAKFDRPPLLHLGFQALFQYWTDHNGTYPPPGEFQEVLELAKKLDKNGLLTDNEGAAQTIIAQLAAGACAVLSPMCASLGGIVGQEVLKACSGKFTPISGFFYLDAVECLPDDPLSGEEIAVTGTSRYDSQIAVFGKSTQQKLGDLNYFLVGAGAIGCEMLKNWALMGVGCGPKGKIHMTDMDRIEKSNLSRQFLFRTKDIDQFKSTTAANAAKAMNPSLNIVSYQEKVAAETEHLFGDDFYDQLNGVCTALDNVEARLYVDQKCLFYRLPMLESGTLGTKGNTQIVVPGLTENYGATRDPPEKSIPVCTLKNFPNQIQHTLQWARDYFEGIFKQSPDDANAYLHGHLPTEANTKLDTYRKIQKTLLDERPVHFEDCVVWARLTFEDLFHNQILQLLHNFPEDQVTSSGTKFWSGSKRCPKPLKFDWESTCDDAQMKNHLDFIIAAANLRAHMYGIQGRTDPEYFQQTLTNIMVPTFTPADGVKIAANDAEAKKESSTEAPDADEECEQILAQLPKASELAGFQLHPIDFDKDIDEHMLFVTACSNLRALNYSIPTEDTHRSRAIAGRIIPAIATTTALVTGLVCLELYKVIGSARKELKLDAYKNGFLNLAIPFMTLSEPTPPGTTKCMLKGKEWNWTAWDSLDMNMGDITLQQFMDHFANEYNLEISMLSHGVSILYSFFANKKKVEERKKMKMSEVVKSITKKEFPPNQLFIILELIANDMDTDDEVELPYIKFRFR